MQNRKTRLYLILVPLLVVLSGCFPMPWKKQYFESVHFSYGSWHTPDLTKESEPYFVAGRYFHMIAPAENGTTSSGNSPYYLIGSIGNKSNGIEGANILNINIRINGRPYTSYSVTKCAGLVDISMRNQEFELPYYLSATEYRHSGVSFCVSPIHVDFDKVHSMEVFTEIVVSTSMKTERKLVVHKFTPKVKGGLFTWGEV